MNFCVYGASSNTIDNIYISGGENLGEIMALRGHGLVFGGGATGMMGAVARGVRRENGYVLGIAPKFFDADGILFEDCSEFIYTKTMRERKKLLEEKSDAFIITPGGIGTYDEFFEILTLRQLSQHKKPIAILNIDNYFGYMLKMLDYTIEKNFMTSANKELYFVTSDPNELITYLENYKSQDFELDQLKDIAK